MLSMNETLSSLNNRLSSMEDKQMSCFVNMKLWLLIHLFVTLLIELLFMYIFIIFLFICIFFSVFCPRWYRLFHAIVENNGLQTYEEERYSNVIRFFRKEMILIFFYVFFAFMYTWFELVDSSITCMTCYRWLIEALLAPLALTGAFCGYYLGFRENVFDKHQTFYILAFVIKIPLFFFMRYAESKNDFFLNDWKASVFYLLCKSSSK